jgi:RNA polymerase sigma factor (sigma-70 family)
MAGSVAVPTPPAREDTAESGQVLPAEVADLLAATPGAEADSAWAAFLAVYSPLLLKVASTFAPGYDGALDRYAYMLDEIRRGDCRRLRAYSADGRGRFSTWLAVVARRLCLDHYRQRYGRDRGGSRPTVTPDRSRAARRGLVDLCGAPDELCGLADTSLADPADEVDTHTRQASLHRAIDLLCPGDRLLIRLRFEQELTAREIAPLLGLPSPFHVYRRLDRVCGELRARLTGGPENSEFGGHRPVQRRASRPKVEMKTCAVS